MVPPRPARKHCSTSTGGCCARSRAGRRLISADAGARGAGAPAAARRRSIEPDAMDIRRAAPGLSARIRRYGGWSRLGDAERRACAACRCVMAGRAPAAGATRPIAVVAAAGACVRRCRRASPGRAPIGLVPKRRPAFVSAPPADASQASGCLRRHRRVVVRQARMPACCSARRPIADPVAPQDVVAGGAPTSRSPSTASNDDDAVQRPTRRWAGLRSFVADGDLVGACSTRKWRACSGSRRRRLRHPDLGARWAQVRRARPRPAALPAKKQGVAARAGSGASRCCAPVRDSGGVAPEDQLRWHAKAAPRARYRSAARKRGFRPAPALVNRRRRQPRDREIDRIGHQVARRRTGLGAGRSYLQSKLRRERTISRLVVHGRSIDVLHPIYTELVASSRPADGRWLRQMPGTPSTPRIHGVVATSRWRRRERGMAHACRSALIASRGTPAARP